MAVAKRTTKVYNTPQTAKPLESGPELLQQHIKPRREGLRQTT